MKIIFFKKKCLECSREEVRDCSRKVFSDFRWENASDNHPPIPEYLNYLHRYCKKFGLYKFIYFTLFLSISLNLQSQNIKKQKELENKSRILKKEIKKINELLFSNEKKKKNA